jgi:predicted dehydrogenase
MMSVNKQQLKPIEAVIVGAGHRSLLYASYSQQHPDQFKIVGVVDPDPVRREHTAKMYELPSDRCFGSIESFIEQPKFADAVINGTMDQVHVKTSLPILKAGYDILLEKPIGISQEEVTELLQTARKYDRCVLVCHVLRYAPFYREIKQRIAGGLIGDIVAIQTEENVSYHHMAVSYIRGKWGNEEKCKSTMLMAKSCHDLDMITWMMEGIRPKRVSSFGSLMQFKPENAPKGAGKRCLLDCEIENSCPYSAKKNYIEQQLWDDYVWQELENITFAPTLEQKLDSLKNTNPFGRCVWHTDNNVVDHQTVNIEFENGATASHHMIGATSKPCRTIHIAGTKGEITGVMEDGYFVVRHPDARKGHQYSEEKIQLEVSADMHGGGDLLLVEDFVKVLRDGKPSISTTSLADSTYGHLIGFNADDSRRSGKIIEIQML